MRYLHFDSIQSASEGLYRRLLFLYPAQYRREYGPLMTQAYRDLCRDSCQQRGTAGLVLLWFRLLADLVTSALRQHLDELREGDSIMTKKEHFLAIIAATVPLVLWLVLGVVNPSFTSRMFIKSSAQPWGWIMIAAVFILMSLAYFSQRKAIELSNRPNASKPGAGRHVVRDLLRGGSIALFILPAILLVLLGPAIMMLLESGA
jgi:hypothetical protein